MKEWWDGLAARERLILAGGGVLLVLALLWALLWQPLVSGVRELESEVAAQRENLRWMQNAAAELQQLRGRGARAAAGLAGRSLLAVADQSARSAGLGSGLKRIEPDNGNAVRVRLEGVAFDDVVVWLDGLAREAGVLATTIAIERANAPGQVNVRLTLAASAS